MRYGIEPGWSTLIHVATAAAGCDVTRTHVLLWNATEAEVYQSTGMGLQQVAAFPYQGSALALYADSLFRPAGQTVEVCNLAGVVKQTLVVDEVGS